jgi:hypothetical protein
MKKKVHYNNSDYECENSGGFRIYLIVVCSGSVGLVFAFGFGFEFEFEFGACDFRFGSIL